MVCNLVRHWLLFARPDWTSNPSRSKVVAPKGWQQPEIAESARPFEPDPVSTGVGIGKRLGLRSACQPDAICLGPQ